MDFDDPLYLALNDDIARAIAAGIVRDAASHWHHAGATEERAGVRPSLAETAVAPPPAVFPAAPDGFAARFYLDAHADLRAAFGTDEDAARRHWAEHGRVEGRFAAGDVAFTRAPDLAALLARPFGVDLYLQVDDHGIAATLGRRLLRALRDAAIPVSLRPFIDRGGRILLPGGDVNRPGTFRASLLAATPSIVRRLQRAHPERHFDAAYLIAALPDAPWQPRTPDFPTLCAVDEVWLPAREACARLRTISPVPVHHVPLPAAPLLPREEARAILGIPTDGPWALLDEAELGPDTLRARAETLLDDADATRLLVRAAPAAVAAAERALARLPALVRLDRRVDGGSLLLAAADLLLADTVALAPDIIDARAAGRAVRGAAAAAVGSGAALGASSRAIAERFAQLGLDAPPPPFARILASPRPAGLPLPPPHQRRELRPGLPVVSFVLAAPLAGPAALADLLRALDAQPHPLWELCATAGFPAAHRDPRVRLSPPRPGETRAARLNEGLSLATGTWFLPARDAADARFLAAWLSALLPRLEGDEADVLLPAAAGAEADHPAERIESGGPDALPLAFRRATAIDLVATAAGGGQGSGPFRDRYGPAAERDLLLRLLAAGARVRTLPGLPERPLHPAEDEAYRLALSEHLRGRVGPLVRAVPGARPGASTRRTRATSRHATLLLPGRARPPSGFPAFLELVDFIPADLFVLDTEPLLLADPALAHAAPGAVERLLEWLAEDEVGAVGARIDAADGTLHEAGLEVDEQGRLLAPGRHLPADPAFTPHAFALRNPPAVGGVLAVRRTVLTQAGGFDQALRHAGAAVPLLAADLCLRLARDFGLRTVFVPDAVFVRAPEPPLPALAEPAPTPAEQLFAARWSAALG